MFSQILYKHKILLQVILLSKIQICTKGHFCTGWIFKNFTTDTLTRHVAWYVSAKICRNVVLEIANCPWFVKVHLFTNKLFRSTAKFKFEKLLWRLHNDRFLIQIQCFGVSNSSFTDEFLWMTLYQHPATLNWIFQKSE